MSEKRAILVYLVDPLAKTVWLGMKKRDYAEGKWNGFGGKVDPGELTIAAAVREVREESWVTVAPQDLKPVATLHYHEDPEDWVVYVYRCTKWKGVPKETDEMRPQLFRIDSLPYDQMWDNDKLWIEKILLTDANLIGRFRLNSEGKVSEHSIRER